MAKLIYIVEDDRDDLSIIVQAIKEIEPQSIIQSFKDGFELLTFIEKENNVSRPDLFIIDYNMPRLNGIQTLESLNDKAYYRPIPKVIYSTSSFLGHKEEAKRAGALAYIEKGFSYEQIKEDIVLILSFGSSSKERMV